jgi:hypothetical protein
MHATMRMMMMRMMMMMIVVVTLELQSKQQAIAAPYEDPQPQRIAHTHITMPAEP